jgi:hypothetical protein
MLNHKEEAGDVGGTSAIGGQRRCTTSQGIVYVAGDRVLVVLVLGYGVEYEILK